MDYIYSIIYQFFSKAKTLISKLRSRLYLSYLIRQVSSTSRKNLLSCRIMSGVVVFKPNNLSIGEECFIGENTRILCHSNVSIGSRTLLASNICIFTRDHLHKNIQRLVPPLYKYAPVEIGNDCWIGASVFILPGVKIGDRVVVACNSVVTGTLEPNAVYAGSPAKLVASR